MRQKRETQQRAHEATLEQDVADLVAVLARYPDGKRPCFGAPSRCPDCGDFGMVDQVDQARGRCLNRCLVCSRQWVITVGALNEVAKWRAAKPAYQGTGALTAALAAASAVEVPAPRPAVTTPSPTPTPLLARMIPGQIRPA
jgi:hypothetical protein